MRPQQQDPIFTDTAAYHAALKTLITYIKFRFKTLSSDAIQDIAINALTEAYYYERLTISVLSFSRKIGLRRALDLTERESVKQRYLSRINQDTFFYPDTEGVLDDDERFIVRAIQENVKKRSKDSQNLFWADLDPKFEDFTDDQKAEVLDLKASAAIRKRRCDTKKAIIRNIEDTPQYLSVSYRWRQRA
jgi:hypothetical protein